MQIAQALSGYSLGEADMLRRAMGKKIKSEMDAQRARFVNGAVERGLDQGQGRRDLRPARQIRRLRLQQEPRRGLRADRLLDRLVQGQSPGRVPRRLDDARQGQHRQARRIPRRGAAARHPVAPPSVNGSDVDFDVRQDAAGGAVDRLCAERDQGRRRRPGGGDRRGARRAAVRLARATSRGASIRAPSTRRRWRASPPPGPSTNWSPTAPSPSPRSSRCWRSPTAAPRRRRPGQNALFGEAEAAPLKVARRRPGRRPIGCRREFDAVGFFLSGHPLEAYDSALKRLRATRWADFVARGARRRHDRAARRQRARPLRAAHQERLEDGHHPALRPVSGQYEAIMFQEGLSQYRDLLEKGSDVLVTLAGQRRGRGRARAHRPRRNR